MLTGASAREHGVWHNHASIPEGLETYASVLAGAGYRTGYFGKWHLERSSPTSHGFDETVKYLGQGDYFEAKLRNEEGKRIPLMENWLDDRVASLAVDFMRRNRDLPFLAVVGFKSTHGPRTPPDRARDMYEGAPFKPLANEGAFPPFPMGNEFLPLAEAAGKDFEDFDPPSDWRDKWQAERVTQLLFAGEKGEPEYLRDYYRVVRALDDTVGQILDAIDGLGIGDETLVVFISDNGFLNGEHGLLGKRVAYEESVRIPFVARYPALIEPAERSELVLNVDLAPTILDYCGVSVPQTMEGRSLRRVIEGKPAGWREEFLYEYRWTSDNQQKTWVPSHVAIRTEDAKLIVYDGHPAWSQLFDLQTDPYETTNRYDDPSFESVRQNLASRLDSLLSRR